MHMLGLRFILRPWERASQIGAGNWWADLFGSLTSNEYLGLIHWSDLPTPVVCVQGCESVLMASSPASLIPVVIYRTGLDAGAESWLQRRAAWGAIRQQALAAHRALGGKDELAVLERVLFNDRLLGAITAQPAAAQELMRGRILATLDIHPSHQAYRRYLNRLIEHGFCWPPPAQLGLWYGAAAAAALVSAPLTSLPRPAILECAWALLQWPAGLGLCHPGTPVQIDLPAGGQAATVLELAAELLIAAGSDIPSGCAKDPRMDAVRALAAGDYEGTWQGYHRSVTSLLASGSTRAAWSALLSATFWQSQAVGAASTDLFEYGLNFSRAARWSGVARPLEKIGQCDAEVAALRPGSSC